MPGCVNKASAIAKSEVETLRLSSQDFQARLNPKTVNCFREVAMGYPSKSVVEVTITTTLIIIIMIIIIGVVQR